MMVFDLTSIREAVATVILAIAFWILSPIMVADAINRAIQRRRSYKFQLAVGRMIMSKDPRMTISEKEALAKLFAEATSAL